MHFCFPQDAAEILSVTWKGLDQQKAVEAVMVGGNPQ